ncbi:hypothetical protein LTR70_004649 [Exophiala xenobiotica]|uniref:DNA-directed RNA polymerase II subunit RPB9-like zinc ribbon domain-containing protein n=1 Tax=Lithohypha guttulata TaxID=1690604 RepID=A0ABR0KCN5_9EURO|nr:hypothetical protein LTR24_004231 [Lithohypha guttulata]KAK5320286.1 hypothetical protein LTR70_004649 [Exophiala xenobiotica]
MSAASPTVSEQGAGTGEIAYKFCQECSNLLYPREDRQLNQLLYICKACSSVQQSEPACTYRQILSEAAQESMGEKAYVANDPTVGEDVLCFCTMCGNCLKCATCGEPNGDDSERSEEDLDDSSRAS